MSNEINPNDISEFSNTNLFTIQKYCGSYLMLNDIILFNENDESNELVYKIISKSGSIIVWGTPNSKYEIKLQHLKTGNVINASVYSNTYYNVLKPIIKINF